MRSIYPILLVLLVGLFNPACTDEDCSDCGGNISEGYLFRQVTEEDMDQLLPVFPDIKLETCIRFKLELTGSEIDLESVTVVDDCCCDR